MCRTVFRCKLCQVHHAESAPWVRTCSSSRSRNAGSTELDEFSLPPIAIESNISLPLDKSRFPRNILPTTLNQLRQKLRVRIGINTLPHRSTICLSLIDKTKPASKTSALPSHPITSKSVCSIGTSSPHPFLLPNLIRLPHKIRARRLAYSQRHEFRMRVPRQVITRVKEISTAQLLKTAQSFADSDKS
jgi:hypothetical protein